jgi:hypothetical protein
MLVCSSTAFLQHACNKQGFDQYLSLWWYYKPPVTSILPFQLVETNSTMMNSRLSDTGSYNCSCDFEQHATIKRVPLHSVIFSCFYTTLYVAAKQVLLLLSLVFRNTPGSSMIRQSLIKFHCLTPFGKIIIFFVNIAINSTVSTQFYIAHILTHVLMPFNCYRNRNSRSQVRKKKYFHVKWSKRKANITRPINGTRGQFYSDVWKARQYMFQILFFL